MRRIITLTCFLVVIFLSQRLQAGQAIPLTSDLNDISQWTQNSSGSVEQSWDETEGAMCFRVQFNLGVDRWIYPVYKFRKENETLASATSLTFEIKTSSDKVRCAYLMLLPNDSKIPYPLPSTCWKRVTIPLKKEMNPEITNAFRLGLNPQEDRFTYWIRNLHVHTKENEKDVAGLIASEAPGMVFAEGRAVTLKAVLKQKTTPARYVISDFWSNCVKNGIWDFAASPTLELGSFPLGYYYLELESDDLNYTGYKTFAVVVNPEKRKQTPDSFFAIDTAQSWLAKASGDNPRFTQEGFETVSDLCRLAGFGMVRDRLSWSGVRKTAESPYNWAQYPLNADLLNERGIKVCGMFHDAPQWTRSPNSEKSKSGQTNVPDDLLQTYQFTKELAKTFKGKMDSWEFWNEQDHPSHKETPWDFAAASKAAYLGFKAGDPDLPVLCGSFCTYPLSNYANLFFLNDGAAYTDIFNYHIYQSLNDYEKAVNNLRQTLAGAGVPDMQIYITENGTNAEGMAQCDSYMKQVRQHSREQEMTVAEFVPKSQILLQALGITRDFFFVLPAYNEREGGKDWGLLRRDYSAKPGFAAFANLTWQLADATYLGTYNIGKHIRSFLYRKPDGSQMLALWRSSALDTGEKNDQAEMLSADTVVKVQPGTYLISDIFGIQQQVDAPDGTVSLHINRYPCYLSGLQGLRPENPFRGFGKAGALKEDKDLTIVIKPYFFNGFSSSPTRNYVMIEKENPQLSLEVFNLSEQKKEGRLVIENIQAQGLPETITLEPMSKSVFSLTCSRLPDSGKQPMSLSVNGVFNGKSISNLYVPLKSIDEITDAKRVPLSTSTVDSWRSNSSGKMSISSEAEGEVKFSVSFTPGQDRWIYPEYILNVPDESFAGALGIEYEIKGCTPEGKQANAPSLLMLVSDTVQEHGTATMVAFAQPEPQWEKRVLLFDESINGENVKMIRLGMNPRVNNYEYTVRNVHVLIPKNSDQ